MDKPIICNVTGGLKPIRFAGGIPGGNMEYDKKCTGNHDIYVAEVVYVESEGKLVVVTVCKGCDNVHFHEKQIAPSKSPAKLLKEKGI
jgi:hypothetical protein